MQGPTPSISAPVPATSVRLASPDSLRAIAALYVVIHHGLQEVWPPRLRIPPSGRFLGWLEYGHFAVTLFIVISGFCLMLPVVRGTGHIRGGAVHFLLRRARRLLIPYYFALLLSAILIWLWIGLRTGTNWDGSIGVTWKGVITHVLIIQNMWDPEMFNHALWSIATEWQLYFTFPILVWLWRKFGPGVTVTGALLAGYVIRYVSVGTRVFKAQPHYLGLFAIGMLAAHLIFSSDPVSSRVRVRVPWSWLSAFMMASFVLFASLSGLQIVLRYEPLLDCFVAILTGSILLAASTPGIVRSVLENRVLVSIGTFSYSIYLIHAPLLQIVYQYVARPLGYSNPMTVMVLVTIGMPFILAASYVFFLCCERPFLNTPLAISLRPPALLRITRARWSSRSADNACTPIPACDLHTP